MMMHHFKLTLKYEKSIEKAFIQVIPLLPKSFQRKLNKISYDIKQGNSIENVINKYQKLFHPFVVQTLSLLKNQLYYDVIIEHTIKHLYLVQKRDDMRQKATRYPFILSMFILLIFIGFFTFLLPFIKQMYVNFNVEPSTIMTTVDLAIVLFSQYFEMILLSIVVLIFIFCILYFKINIKRSIFIWVYSNLRLLKRVYLTFYIRFFTYMQLMLLEKKPIFDVFVELEKRFKHSIYEKDLKTVRLHLEEGQAISDILDRLPLFNSVISHLFQHAQTNEQIQNITSVLSQYYYEELTMRDQQFYAILEPVLISILSVLVGFIALMIYEPILSIYEGL